MPIPRRTYLENAAPSLRLKTSHLLYKADIVIKKQKIGKDWELTTRGVVRIGPKKGNLQTRSIFNKDQDYWESGDYKISGFSVDEKFFKDKSSYIVKSSKENQLPFDPDIEEIVGLLFSIYQNPKASWTASIIVGGKIREVVFDNGSIYLKKKKWAEVREAKIGLEIKVLPLKIKFSLTAGLMS